MNQTVNELSKRWILLEYQWIKMKFLLIKYNGDLVEEEDDDEDIDDDDDDSVDDESIPIDVCRGINSISSSGSCCCLIVLNKNNYHLWIRKEKKSLKNLLHSFRYLFLLFNRGYR